MFGYINLFILGYLPWLLMDILNKYISPTYSIIIICIIIAFPIFKSIKYKDLIGLTFSTGFIAYAINKIYFISLLGIYYKSISLVVAIMALISVIIGQPFTIVYAKATVSKEKWRHPIFIKINNIISLVWALIFFIEYLIRILNISNPNILNTIIVVFGLKFSKSFPNYYKKYFSIKLK